MPDKPILFYDGECGLCHRFVLFVLKHEQEALFQFAALQGETFKGRVTPETARNLPDSIVLLTGKGEMLVMSDAAVYALKTLSPGWRRVGAFIGVFPEPIRDFGYRCVAAVRKKIFRRPKEVCPLVPPELRGRFME